MTDRDKQARQEWVKPELKKVGEMPLVKAGGTPFGDFVSGSTS